MNINHMKEGEITIVTVNGRLDGTTAPVADKTNKKLLKRDCLRMIFDFSTLDYLSNGGLEVIMEATKELRRKEGLATPASKVGFNLTMRLGQVNKWVYDLMHSTSLWT